MELFTKEWIGAVSDKLKNDVEFQKKAVGFDSKLQFNILQDPKAGLKEDRSCGLVIPQATETWSEERPKEEVDIILQSKYGDILKVFQGKQKPLIAISTGKIKLKKGSVGKLTSYLGMINEFIRITGTVS